MQGQRNPNPSATSDEVTPLEAAQLALIEHNRLCEIVMGLVEMIDAIQEGRTKGQRIDVPKLRKTVGLVKSLRAMHDCLTFLCPELPELDEEEEK